MVKLNKARGELAEEETTVLPKRYDLGDSVGVEGWGEEERDGDDM